MKTKKFDQFEVLEFLKESNAIEGVYDDRSLEQSIYAWNYLIAQGKLTPGVILKTHKILMLHQPLKPNEKGYFRKVACYIAGRKAIHPLFVESAIEEWCKQVNKYTPRRQGLFGPVALHVLYEEIHPFVDGNGRTGRLFLNWMRLKKSHEPIMIIKEEDRQEYYKWFE